MAPRLDDDGVGMFDDRRRISPSHHLISSAGKVAVDLVTGVGVHL